MLGLAHMANQLPAEALERDSGFHCIERHAPITADGIGNERLSKWIECLGSGNQVHSSIKQPDQGLYAGASGVLIASMPTTIEVGVGQY